MQEKLSSNYCGFTFRVRKNGDVEVFHFGRLASTLRGSDAEDFKQDAPDEASDDAQQLMARLTGITNTATSAPQLSIRETKNSFYKALDPWPPMH